MMIEFESNKDKWEEIDEDNYENERQNWTNKERECQYG